MFNKYLIIFFILILIITILIIMNYIFKYSETKKIKNMYLEKFSNKIDITIKEPEIQYDNNLIKNGSFEHGKNSTNYINQNGYNKIIMKKNPGSSSYVLEQKNTEQLTYYELNCKCDKNSKYVLHFWLSVNENKYSIDELDFEKLIKIKIQNEDFSNYIPKLNYNIVQKVVMNNDENTWYLLKYNFLSSNESLNKMQIYLNYSETLQYEYYYFTGISLNKVLIDAENFIYNDQLISYVDGYHYESNILTWHDLSGKGNDLFFSTTPIIDYTKGTVNIYNLKITGFPANTISNNNFTILLCLNQNFENIASNESVDTKNNLMKFYLLSMPGNDKYSFEIEMRDKYLYVICGNDEYKSNNELILYNKTLISITYTDGTINVYQDGIIILSQKITKIYFNNNNMMINKNKNLDYTLYNVLCYNRVVLHKELNDIREYFITNQSKNFNTPDINNYHMDNNAQYTVNNNEKYLFQPYNKKLNETYNNFENNKFTDNFDNQNNFMKYDKDICQKECENLCKNFLDYNNLDKYNYCMNKYKNKLLSCKNTKVINSEDDEGNTEININIYNKPEENKLTCPKVYKKNNNFIVYVQPNSYYANKLNYTGEKSYGSNLEKARYLYNLNFPKCPTPVELMHGEGKKYIETCPYIVNEANPCYTNVCAGVNWDVDNYKDLKINNKCKKTVSNYCQINYSLDENCVCWNPKYKDDPKCIEFRRHFEDPNDYCSPNQFKIEEHPDFNKYIKKDNIPCWGCKIDP